MPLRGLKANLDAGLADILEGELCYATDEDILYMKEEGVLVPTGSAASERAGGWNGGNFTTGESDTPDSLEADGGVFSA